MAEREQSSGFNPKHRVIGAVILVAAAVVIVPLVLNKREPPPTDQKSDGPTKTIVADVPPPGTTAQSPTASSPSTIAPAPNPAAANGTSPPPSETSVTQPLSMPEPAPVKPTSPPDAKPLQQSIVKKIPPVEKTHTAKGHKTHLKGWFLQVGTFSNPKNARALADKLKHMGFHAGTETVTIGSNKVVRVRLGLYSKEAQAKKAQLDLQKRAGINGIVGHY